jgi:hypothetical protein
MKAFFVTAVAFGLFVQSGIAQAPDPVMIAGTTAAASALVTPDQGISGRYGTWSVTVTVRERIESGGGIRVQLPDVWHAGPRNSANRLQATDPTGDHYVSALCSNDDVVIRTVVENERDGTLIKHEKESLDGRSERYVFVVRVIVEGGALKADDMISVIYGDRREGSRGYRAGAVSTGPLPVLVAIDTDGEGEFQLLDDAPRLTIHPNKPVEMQVHAPSIAVVGKPVRLLVSTLDQEDNGARGGDDISIRVSEGEASMAESITIKEGVGFAEFELTPTSEGIVRVEAVSKKWVFRAVSNPIRVVDQSLDENIFWGDIHSHTRFSWDGVGYHNFDHARNVAGLDFYAMTDHSRTGRDGRTRGLSPSTWEEYTGLSDEHHDPPNFVTLHAYEASFGRPYGHHIVYFRGAPGPLIAPEDHRLPALWEMLTAGDALTIPHHTGKMPQGVDFGIHDERFRRNFELYSGHGLSETFDPGHPLSFERSTFTSPARSQNAPAHFQDALRKGLVLSTVAASDDHRSHPGLPHWGLTAVFAPELTRDAVFQALHDRRTYATSGQKILLDFQIDGVPMGQMVATNDAPVIEVSAVGTDVISRVELLCHRAGDHRFRVIKSWHPDEAHFSGSFTDSDFGARGTYYVRLRQAAPVRDRIGMAWSSPIWVSRKTE